MQLKRFDDGGFVLHKITGLCSGRISAWFDHSGTLLDCEQITDRNIVRSIKKNGPIWRQLERIGNRHKQ